MVSFELGKKIEKDVFFVLSRAWGEEKILSPCGELNPRPLDSAREVQKIPPEQVLEWQSIRCYWRNYNKLLFLFQSISLIKHNIKHEIKVAITNWI